MQAVYRPDENAADIFFDVSFQNAEVMAHGLPQLSIKQNNVNDFRTLMTSQGSETVTAMFWQNGITVITRAR